MQASEPETSGGESGKPSRLGRALLLTLIACLALELAAMMTWSLATPAGRDPDEAGYVLQALRDVRFAESGGVARLARALVFEDAMRPPAYRMIGFPPAFATYSIHGLRAAWALLFLITGVMVWRTAAPLGGEAAGALASLLFLASPGIVNSAAFYGTEGPLLLATAALLYSALKPRLSNGARTAWAGLSLALGLMSKVSFPAIAGPLLAVAWLLFPTRRRPLFAGGLVALVLCAPWYWWNWGQTLTYARSATRPDAHSLLPVWGLHTLTTKAILLLAWLPGIAGVLVLAALFVVRKGEGSGTRGKELAVCLASAVPLIALAFASGYFNTRYYTPAMIPLSVAAGMLLAARKEAWVKIASAAVCVLQVVAISAVPMLRLESPAGAPEPVRALGSALMTRCTSDWTSLPDLIHRPAPTVLFFGAAHDLDGSQLEYAWLARRLEAHAYSIWHPDGGPVSWPEVAGKLPLADGAVVPVTAEDAPADTNYATMIRLLDSDPGFAPPARLATGCGDHVRVYVRRSAR